jgi:hypothetical protein
MTFSLRSQGTIDVMDGAFAVPEENRPRPREIEMFAGNPVRDASAPPARRADAATSRRRQWRKILDGCRIFAAQVPGKIPGRRKPAVFCATVREDPSPESGIRPALW